MNATPSTNTAWIALPQIDLPTNAREHSPEDLESLASDMRENGQLQEIIVTPISSGSSTRYEVVAGVGRTRAARQLQWDRIRCLVRPGLSPFEKLRITFSENEEREEVSPLYQAGLLKSMLDANHLTQEALAKRIGKTQARVNQYLALTKLAPDIQRTVAKWPLTLAHFTELCRLDLPADQLQIAHNAVKNGLSVKALHQRVNERLSDRDRPLRRRGSPLPEKSSPASDIVRSGDVIEIKTTFRPLAQTLDAFLERLRQRLTILMPAAPAASHSATAPSAPASSAAPVQKTLEDYRLPQSDAERRELSQWAADGPGGFYAWVYGPSSALARAMEGKTWESLGVTDPSEKINKLLEGLRLRYVTSSPLS
jgi:ParB/RepB/Spo0J family partition protein